MAKYTEGEWKVTGTNKNIVYSKSFLCQVMSNASNPFITDEELEADAQLIACAPELLKACKNALEYLKLSNKAGATQNILKQAIAKAEGV